jgi:hypothetical protein
MWYEYIIIGYHPQLLNNELNDAGAHCYLLFPLLRLITQQVVEFLKVIIAEVVERKQRLKH